MLGCLYLKSSSHFLSYPQFTRSYDSNLDENGLNRTKAISEKGILVLLLYNHSSSQKTSVVTPDYHWYQHSQEGVAHVSACVCTCVHPRKCVETHRDVSHLKLYHNKIKSIIIMEMWLCKKMCIFLGEAYRGMKEWNDLISVICFEIL